MVQGRWGHKAVYVEATKSVYIVGGEISGDGLQITNEVLQLDLNQDSSTPTPLTSTSLTPLAFHSLTYSPTTNELVTFGGLTSSCSEDSILHSYSLDTETWRSENANGLIRRRGAGMVFNQGDGSTAAGGEEGALMVFGGIADQYSCSAITYAYPAFDILPVPLSSYPTFQTERMTINGGIQGFAVSDFGMAALPNNTVLFLGGSDKDGNMVEMNKLTGWSSERDWYQLELGGDVPEARVGGGMTVHPTLSDLVIFQGGATKDGDNPTPVPTLNFLNLTTLEWFTPANLQPPASYARAWHGSTMTSSGVIVTSFGLGSTGTPRDDITFLDLSNPDASKWSWKSVWSSSMLTAPEGTSSGSVTTTSGLQTDTNNNGSSSNEDKELKSILPPVLIVGIILLGLGMWLARRQVGIVRRRRLARHFEIDATHDEDGNRRGSTMNIPNPLAQFMASRGWKRQSSFAGMGAAGSSSGALPRPFGGIKIPEADAESVKSAAAAIKSKVTGILKRWSGGHQGEGDRSREMTQTGGQGAARVQWEEIDFGLGRVDEQRRGPVHGSQSSRAPNSSSQAGPVGQIAKGQFGKNRSRVSYDGDLADAQELPEVVVVPPSNPVTPMPALNSDGSEMKSFPVLAPSPKIDDPETARREAASKARASAEWDDFAKDVQTRNPFADPEPIYADDGEENNTLPPLAFQRNSVTDFSTGLSGYGIGLGQPSRRVSTSDASVSRSVSSPHSNARASVYSNGSGSRDLMTGSPTRGQELTRSVSDRTRNLANMFTRSSVDSNVPEDANITPLRNSSRQRLSNPPLGPPPTSPLPNAPNSAFNGRRVSAGALPGSMPADGTVVRTASGDRHLHIANPSFDSEVDEFGSSHSHGQAL